MAAKDPNYAVRRDARLRENQRCIHIVRDELRGRVDRLTIELIVRRLLDKKDEAMGSQQASTAPGEGK